MGGADRSQVGRERVAEQDFQDVLAGPSKTGEGEAIRRQEVNTGRRAVQPHLGRPAHPSEVEAEIARHVAGQAEGRSRVSRAR